MQLIDDFHRNHKLGAVIAASVGKGSLLATSFDLSTDLDTRPVARQMLYSLQEYARGDRFHPAHALSIEDLEKLLHWLCPIRNFSLCRDSCCIGHAVTRRKVIPLREIARK